MERVKASKVPIAVYFDHGFTFEACMEALKCGFTSVMFDGSSHSFEENIRQTKEIVRVAHSFRASVEGEIGHVGQANLSEDTNEDLYTTVEEATNFINNTGVDALAISIGTAHGKYVKKPKLDIGRLNEIKAVVDTPLVLHGGFGLSRDDFRQCVEKGISKVNIFTDLCIAGEDAMRDMFNANLTYVEIRQKRYEKMKESVIEKIKLFGSMNRV